MRQSFSDTEDTFLESLQPACRIGPILLSYTWLVTSGLPPTRFRDANDAENKQSRANLLSFCTLCDERLQVIVVITFLIHEMSDSCEKLVMIILVFDIYLCISLHLRSLSYTFDILLEKKQLKNVLFFEWLIHELTYC